MKESFTELVDLVSERVGGKAIDCSDDFFASMKNLTRASKPIFIEGKYVPTGKWMDGWESRRKRVPGHDWCILKLGCEGVIKGVNVNTKFFTGNYPEQCSIEAAVSTGKKGEKLRWEEILPITPLKGDGDNLFPISSPKQWTHVKLHIYPDGGVARFNVYGEVRPDWKKLEKKPGLVDLVAVENGGTVLCCNDNHYGHKDNIIMPGRAKNMGDGWETRRRRKPGNDWIVLKLGKPGKIKKIEVDTNFFRGNYPDRCSIEVGNFEKDPTIGDTPNLPWKEMLPRMKLKAHMRHFFQKELAQTDTEVTHLRLQIYPDGGVSRLRVWGKV